MNKPYAALLLALAIALALSLAACSDQAPDENVFKAQTEAIDKAEDAARKLEAAAEAQRQAIEQQGR